jgi:16S rRNA (cytosine967-C5)-methyltransferase
MNLPPPPPPRFRGPRHDARSLALEVLLEVHRHEAFAQELLDRSLGRSPLTPADRRLATQLVYGVLRRRGTLTWLIRPFLNREPQKVEPWLWDALCLGAYQILLLTHIPRHAALNETVELAARFGRPGAKGFLNAVLRKLADLPTEQRTDTPAADALPLETGYRRLTRPALPPPELDPVQYLAAAFSLPTWLAARWSARWPAEECRRLGFWFAGPVPLTLRVNHLRSDRIGFLRACEGSGVAAELGAQPQSVRLPEPVPVRDLPGYLQGWFAVQDESAMLPGLALAPAVGSRVLDLCAAPGGKTTHLAELMRDEGEVIACDVDERRLKTVNELAARLGLNCIRTCRIDPDQPATVPAGPFDAVLLDVPCSNTGVLGKRPEARWRLRPSDLAELPLLQGRLVRLGVDRLKPGGALVYSTCSIEPEENQNVVRALLQERPELRLEAEQESSPGRPADGGYWAKLRKNKDEG